MQHLTIGTLACGHTRCLAGYYDVIYCTRHGHCFKKTASMIFYPVCKISLEHVLHCLRKVAILRDPRQRSREASKTVSVSHFHLPLSNDVKATFCKHVSPMAALRGCVERSGRMFVVRDRGLLIASVHIPCRFWCLDGWARRRTREPWRAVPLMKAFNVSDWCLER